ncbi:MAG: flagellar basal body L-ring protein FlgH [Bacillota bacterium]
MKRILILLMIPVMLFTINTVVFAEDNSLWSDDSADIYKDRKELNVGDIITVLIKEDANAIQSANTSTSQDSSVDADAGIGFLNFLKAFGFGYSDSGSADGQTTRSGTLEADITTQIVEINDTGNLKIEGNKNININGEKQNIKLTGTIRQKDISLDNTISSKNIAKADIEYQGDGPVGDKQKPGFLERLFNWIF